MKRPLLRSLALALVLVLAACAPVPTINVPAYGPAYGDAKGSPAPLPEISEARMKNAVEVLSSDAFEGRAPGSAGEELTLAYLVQEMRSVGLEPGNDGSWFQDVPLVELTAGGFSPLTVSAPAVGKGKAKAQPKALSFIQGKDFVAGSYRVVPDITLAASEMVFVGYGINAPEKGWNDYAGIDMHGKTAVILVNDPDYENADLSGPFNGRAMTYYGRWTYKFEEAARQGAAAALIVHDTFPAAYGWNVVESSWTGAQARAQTSDDGASQNLVNGWVQQDVARQIFVASGRDLVALSAAAKLPGFKPVPLGLKADLSFTNDIRRFESKNVIGILPGKTRPDEYVLYSAHWDHLGRCKADGQGDDICNGAIDNATGTAALLALADAHRRVGAAARSLVFIALTAEESGLLGSEYYGANPVYPLAKTVGGVNMDGLSMAGFARDVTVIGGGKSELDGYLETALAAELRRATPDPNPEKGYYYRSDHFSLAKRGVPMFNIDAGEDLLSGGSAAGAAASRDYTENRYHGPNDEYDPAWNWEGAMADLRLFYRLGRILAESDQWPNWLPGDEFRRVRDESLKPAQ